MSIDNAEKLIDSMQKNPRKTVWIVIVSLILGIVGVVIGTFFSESIKALFFQSNENERIVSKTVQSTYGNQSPLIISNEGNLSVTYGRDSISEMKQVVSKLLEDTPEGTTYTEKELSERISRIYQNLYNILPQQAEDRASQFLATLSIRQEGLKYKYEKQKEFVENIPNNLKITFDYLIQYIDLYSTQIERKSDLIVLKKQAEIGNLFNVKTGGYCIRTINFMDLKHININFNPGVISNDRISTYPSLNFQGFYSDGKPIKEAKFRVWRQIGSGFGSGANPQFGENGFMNEGTKKYFKEQFDKLIDKVIAARI